MLKPFVSSIVVLILTVASFPTLAAMTYLNNGTLTIGVDDLKGGTITYLKDNSDGRDIVNDYDLGREIQQSYYSGPIPFEGANWSGSDWSWNPVAAGDKCNSRSTVLQLTNDDQTIYIERIPKQWGLCNVDSECTMEEWITLEDNVVIIRCRLTNYRSDTTFYGGFHQELPAVYTNSSFRYIYTYDGDSPYTGDTLTEIVSPHPTPPWTYYYSTENWSAVVDSSNWGLGVYNPNTILTAGGFHDNAYSPAATCYLGFIKTEHLDHNIVYEYEFYLILDDLTGIRDWIYQHRPDPLPDYNFRSDRQSWTLANTTDAGFPWLGFMRVNLNIGDPIISGPLDHWDAADVPTLYVRARYNIPFASRTAQMFFSPVSDPTFVGHAVTFSVIPDGQYHTYAVDMSSHADVVKQGRVMMSR